MTTNPSFILIRTQTALRIINSLDKTQQEQLAAVRAELELIEYILTEALANRGSQFETVLDVLSDTLKCALEAIDGIIPEGGAS